MTAAAITSIALDENWHIATYLNESGLRTICLAENARVVSQLVRGVLLTNQEDIPYAPNTGLPWSLYIGQDDPPFQLLGTFINASVSPIYGVIDVDLSQTEFEEDLGNVGPICFTVDCANSVGEFETCL